MQKMYENAKFVGNAQMYLFLFFYYKNDYVSQIFSDFF